jgi:tRNA(Arg) A34 adenosine deaminase TadA
LFSTVGPGPICLGAILMADIPHAVFGLQDKAEFSGMSVESNPYIRRHIQSYYGGVLEAESAAIFARCAPLDLEHIRAGHGQRR